MRIVEKKPLSIYLFQIKIMSKWVTCAELQSWIASTDKWKLFFEYYGQEYNDGFFQRDCINGNQYIFIKRHKDEYYKDFLKRVGKIVQKKLYTTSDDIRENIKIIEICDGRDNYDCDKR